MFEFKAWSSATPDNSENNRFNKEETTMYTIGNNSLFHRCLSSIVLKIKEFLLID